jgi:hypothetical protein
MMLFPLLLIFSLQDNDDQKEDCIRKDQIKEIDNVSQKQAFIDKVPEKIKRLCED